MNKIISTVIFCVFVFSTMADAQSSFPNLTGAYTIVYSTTFNGKEADDGNHTFVFSNKHYTLVTREKNLTNQKDYPFEYYVIDRENNIQMLYAVLGADKVIQAQDSNAIAKQKWIFTNETKTILGHLCKKATTSVNSNLYELWFTDKMKIKGAPTILGQDLGLVLQMVRNGNTVTTAIEIRQSKVDLPECFRPKEVSPLDLLTYRDEIWKSRYVTIPVFNRQRINFTDSLSAQEGVMQYASGTIVVKKIHFPRFSDAKNIFIDLKEQSAGDAYDRTGTVFLIPEDKKISFLEGLNSGVQTLPVYENGNGRKYYGVVATSDYTPALELMRFFTPFGIHHFNYLRLKDKQWQDAVLYRQDITAYSSLLSGKDVYIGVFIGNYDKGGHIIDLNITIHRGGEEQRIPDKVMPLFNTLNIMEMAGQDYGTMFDRDSGLVVEFHLKDTVKNAVLRYITTGHGGWGNGDEFVPKVNTIYLNGQKVWSMIPWREDCGSYRLYNPASGNFNDGLSSSDFSRSNWCPGTITNPYLIPLGTLPAGKYKVQITIPQGAPEGSSFSAWNVSGVLTGD